MKRFLPFLLVFLAWGAVAQVPIYNSRPSGGDGGIAIGGPITGGADTQVLYNSAGTVAGSNNLTFSGTQLLLPANASTGGISIGSAPLQLYYNTVTGYGTLQAPGGASMGHIGALHAFAPSGADASANHSMLFTAATANLALSAASPCLTFQTASPTYTPYAQLCGVSASDEINVVGTNFRFQTGAVGTPTVKFGVDTTTGIYQPSADTIAASISGTQRWLVNSSGTTVTGAISATDTSTSRSNLGMGTLTSPLMSYGGLALNGADTYLDTNALTGIADSKSGSFFIVVRFANAASATETIMSSTGSAFVIQRTATGNLQVLGENAAGTVIMSQTTASAPMAAAGTYAILYSWDLATPASARLYINDTLVTTSGTYTDDTVDLTVTEFSIAGNTAGSLKITGDLYVFWFNPGVALSLDTASVRRKFTDANSVPQYLGRNCQLPTGTTPILCLAYDSAAQWPINRGSSQSTFAQNGTIAAAGTVLYGQWATQEAIGTIKTVTADYTLLATDKTIINNRAATNTLTLPACGTAKNRVLRIVTIQAQLVNSAASNVVPRTGGAAGTAILGAVDGAWTDLECDGTNWISTAGSFYDPGQFMPSWLRDQFAANDSLYAKAA